MVTPILMTIEFRTYKLAMADAEIDLGSYSGSDLEQTEGGEGGSPQKANGVKGHKRFGSVRALAIKKVRAPPTLLQSSRWCCILIGTGVHASM